MSQAAAGAAERGDMVWFRAFLYGTPWQDGYSGDR